MKCLTMSGMKVRGTSTVMKSRLKKYIEPVSSKSYHYLSMRYLPLRARAARRSAHISRSDYIVMLMMVCAYIGNIERQEKKSRASFIVFFFLLVSRAAL